MSEERKLVEIANDSLRWTLSEDFQEAMKQLEEMERSYREDFHADVVQFRTRDADPYSHSSHVCECLHIVGYRYETDEEKAAREAAEAAQRAQQLAWKRQQLTALKRELGEA